MRSLKKYCFLGLVLLAGLTFFACEDTIESPLAGTLTGRILDKETMLPLSDIRISTNPYSDVAETDSSGFFQIDEIEAGEYNVIASHNGYKSESVGITIHFHEITDVEIVLEEIAAPDLTPSFTDSFTPLENGEMYDLEVLFSWQIEETDSVLFDLIIYENDEKAEPVIYENIEDTLLLVDDLRFSTTYFWQVVARRGERDAYSSVHRFSTTSFPYNRILYSQLRNEVMQLFVCDSAGENNSQISFKNYHVWNARLNSQRSSIAFQSTRSIESHLYVMNPDGSDIVGLTAFQPGGFFHEKIEYDWAPNGSHILFSSYQNIYRINSDGSGLKVIATAPEGKNFREVVYSPDGSTIYTIVVGSEVLDRQIYSMNQNGGDLSLLYEDPGFSLASLAVSPDHKYLLFSKDLSGHVSSTGRLLDAHIFQLTIADGTTKDLSGGKPSGTNDLSASYSPDGGYIVFTNSRNTLTAAPTVCTMYNDGSHRRDLIGGGYTPQWFE